MCLICAKRDHVMPRIYKRERVWYFDISVGGRRVRKRVGRSKRVAELALKDAEVQVARDEFGFTKKDISIERLIDQFLDYNRTNHRQSTTKRYKAVTDHLRRYLSDIRPHIVAVSQLNTEALEGYKTYRKDSLVSPNGKNTRANGSISVGTRKGARTRTINLEMDGIKTMLNLAIQWGYLKENPMRHVKPLKIEDAKPVRFLTIEECNKFLKNTPPELYPAYFTFLHTGMRKAELENLMWNDVDFKRRKIFIRPKENWHPKTGNREIPMGDSLLRVLTKLMQKRENISPDAYVLTFKNYGNSHNRLRTELIKIAKKAGITDLTKIHTLRHTFASHLVMKGIDLPTVKELMGHSDIETTMIYAHLSPEHLSDAVNKLSFR